MALAETELISYDVQGRIAVITMRRVPVNAVNYAFIDAIHAAWRRADRDPGVRAIILTSGLAKAFSAGKRGGKSMVLVATETTDGRVRLAHADNNDEATLKQFADAHVAPAAEVRTDGLASYNANAWAHGGTKVSCKSRPSGRCKTRCGASTGRCHC